jgi:hypothetical protein
VCTDYAFEEISAMKMPVNVSVPILAALLILLVIIGTGCVIFEEQEATFPTESELLVQDVEPAAFLCHGHPPSGIGPIVP